MTGKDDLFETSTACVDIENEVVANFDYEIIKYLHKELTKYKRALDIFKRLNGEHLPVYLGIGIISQEEYELLEELMRDEKIN